MQKVLRRLPSVDRVLGDARIQELIGRYAREPVVGLVRGQVDAARRDVLGGAALPSFDEVVARVLTAAEALWTPPLRRVINGTGVVIHTNLGRAPLSDEAIAAMQTAAGGYTNLEYDLDTGERGSRHALLRSLLRELTGAEDAIVVNNNAGAVLLALSALAAGRELIVSRGQAVEIGGGFRIPDVMRQSGAALVEVGTTNRTYVADYERAISSNTAALLRVHTSNFRIVGFTHEVELRDLVELAARHDLTVIDDLGSGCLIDTRTFGLAKEPMVQESVAAGAGVVTMSGDKLLGGPQAGIVVGKKTAIHDLARHPLARALRVDKATLAALAATLLHYLRGEALAKIPIWQMISAPAETIESRARALAAALGPIAALTSGQSTIGGGSLPGETLPTCLVAIGGEDERLAVDLERRLRGGTPPVIARIERNRLLLDLRTVLVREEQDLLEGVRSALAGLRT